MASPPHYAACHWPDLLQSASHNRSETLNPTVLHNSYKHSDHTLLTFASNSCLYSLSNKGISYQVTNKNVNKAQFYILLTVHHEMFLGK